MGTGLAVWVLAGVRAARWWLRTTRALSVREGEVVATAKGDALDLSVGGKSFALQRTKSASGARYEAAGPPVVMFWSRGQAAILTVGSTNYPECKRL